MPGRSSAFGQTILPFRDMLYRRARHLERSSDAADDLVQDTITRALEKSGHYSPGTNLGAWLTTIMSNLFVDRCRRRKREQATPTKVFCALAAEVPEAPQDWQTISHGEVDQAVPLLSPPLRAVMSLYLSGTCSYDRIGKELGVSIATVGTRLFRARRQLRAQLASGASTR